MGISGMLGYFDRKEGKIVTVKENIINENYKRPENFKEVEKRTPNWVIIWGVESGNELLDKIISEETEQNRMSVGLLIYSTMNVVSSNEVIRCFERLKRYDVELYNSFGDDILKSMGLSSSKWWKFW